MRSKRLMIVGLLLVLLTAAAPSAAGCSLSEAKDKAALLAALAEFNLKATPLGLTVVSTDKNATVTSDGTPVATAIKDGLAGIADEWESVVAKAKKVDGADAEAAEKAWTDLDEAVQSVPADATAGEAGALVGAPLSALMAARDQLTAAATGSD